jgi:YfiH family protein
MNIIEPDWPAPPNVVALSTTRQGGHSQAEYQGLNLGHHVGDDPDAVQANRQWLQQQLPFGATIQWLSQVHGNTSIAAGGACQYPEADACWSSAPGQGCAILTADCLPVLLCNRGGTAVAAAHAGWRGLSGGVLEATVASMQVDPQSVMAWLGPAIGPWAFEVGAEVKSAFLTAAKGSSLDAVRSSFRALPEKPDHYYADLYGLARDRLARAGVTEVYGGQYCTFSDPRRFFSYRRDGITGRMASLICLKTNQ